MTIKSKNFSKEDIIRGESNSVERILLDMVLEPNKKYTLDQAKKAVEKLKKKEVI